MISGINTFCIKSKNQRLLNMGIKYTQTFAFVKYYIVKICYEIAKACDMICRPIAGN